MEGGGTHREGDAGTLQTGLACLLCFRARSAAIGAWNQATDIGIEGIMQNKQTGSACGEPRVPAALTPLICALTVAGPRRSPGDDMRYPAPPYLDDNDKLAVLEAGADGWMQARMRFDLSRQDLLRIGRSAAPDERRREVEEDGSGADDGEGRPDEDRQEGAFRQRPKAVGSVASLRDIQVLQCKSEPAILVRRGVILVCLEPLKAMVTARRLLVVVPPASDAVLEPIRVKLHAAAKQRLAGEGEARAHNHAAALGGCRRVGLCLHRLRRAGQSGRRLPTAWRWGARGSWLLASFS